MLQCNRGRPELFDKACASAADALTFDLEDAVAASKKLDARVTLTKWMDAQSGIDSKKIIIVQVNAMTNEFFRPSDDAIAQALSVLEAAKEADAKGIGDYVIDGKMIDPPFFQSADKLVDSAKRLGLI